MLIDHQQRSQATDPGRSFIVQAPAGSGKTEILTQRFLRLLSTVNAPEQIIALTFTRKAANEMRERIIIALKQAAQGKQAESAHQQQTLKFAQEALRRSEQFNWQLSEQPSRLKIMTIDALCQAISQAMPLQEKQIPFAGITDKAETCFKMAARNCLHFAMDTPDFQPAVKTLLIHLDNRQDVLIELFSKLLGNRDQWLALLYQGRSQDKALYEEALTLIEQHELMRFRQTLPTLLAEELVNQARLVTEIEANPESPRYPLRNWYQFEACDANMAKALAALILGSDHNLRKSFDHYVGFRKENTTAKEYTAIKKASQELLTQLNDYPDFLEALLRVRDLPSPHYDLQQWETLNALFTLLPLLVGHLQLVFAEQNEVDFTAIAQQALLALGDEEQPTDLALYLDYSIQHLLVDEFQDTSITQYQLLNQLVQGWQQGDGRTLFVVGDPMQSIYRFRQAEVGLFLRVQQQGLGPVNLTPLELQCNFRSTVNIVQWVNQQFPHIFPKQVDIESGAVSFHSSEPVLKSSEDSSIHAWQFASKAQEAQALVALVKERLEQHPDEDMAILVRSRSQLSDIVRLLREARVPYQGVEIDLLAKLPHIRDLWSLTQALLMPAHRLSWLALLRSPYVGLSLRDIHRLASSAPKKSIYQILSQGPVLASLSEEGQARASYFYSIMDKAIRNRFQSPLSEWIHQTHKQLKGDLLLTKAEEKELEQFYLLLDRLQSNDQITDIAAFEAELEKLYSQQVTPSKLQIMTIHKSKGLEFDCVILPSLSSPPKSQEKPLLRWLKLPTQDQQDLLLLSPLKASSEEKCDLYNYLAKLDGQKSSYELQRLLYVAATRAKKNLYLLDNRNKAPKDSFRSLFKQQAFIEHADDQENTEHEDTLPQLFKLQLEDYISPLQETEQRVNPVNPFFSSDKARIAGVIAHKMLQWICDKHPVSYQDLPWTYVNQELHRYGFEPQTQDEIRQQLDQWFNQLYACPTGQWIIAPHQDEHNEYELLVEKNGLIKTKIIDRTFVENKRLWIIDFKTGQDDEQSKASHEKQVNDYAQILSSRCALEIHCGLYYLNSNHWHSWHYAL